uniref:Uncharacterized protein n=1 Tax=Avena sativa TaxID=4498 RepID=A0ACD5V517_AVESA
MQTLEAPMLVSSSSATAAAPLAPAPAAGHRKMLNWNDTMVFDSAVLDGGDALVFAKGPSCRQGVIRTPAANVQCIYRGDTDGSEASVPAITSGQQVIRCPPPPPPLVSRNIDIHVTLALNGEEPVPSLATYDLHQAGLSVAPQRNLICACTMVRNVAKFLHEWVLYHSSIGVGQFFLYDNGSEDDLIDQVARLRATGINILTVSWPWTKTQEAGLSHCAAMHRNSCQWMAFIDVDEFIFSPDWIKFEKPSKSMLEALVPVDPHVGQVYFPCYDFGPSGQTAHPREGVCQGYTCRLDKPQRHKSLVLLDAVADSFVNSVHHFSLKAGFHFAWNLLVHVNHYKYQAWVEFKSKFKRRVSTFVPDWSDPVNLQSRDRAPGLGVDPIEPVGWADSFCEIKDETMHEASVRLFVCFCSVTPPVLLVRWALVARVAEYWYFEMQPSKELQMG